MPNFDVWYPLGISATVYSFMTFWLAIKRLATKIRKRLGLPTKEEELVESPPHQTIQIEYPIAVTPMRQLELTAPVVPKNDL